MSQSASNDNYLVHLRNFILDEVEADIVYLQNKTIGKNHIQWDPNYHYKAWYKAVDKIVFGSNVTPKTDPGEYTVEPNGKLTLHAGDAIVIKEGTHFKSGAIVHIKPVYQSCSNANLTAGGTGLPTADSESEYNMTYRNANEVLNDSKQNDFMIYPNPAEKTVTIMSENRSIPESIEFYNLQGRKVLQKNSKQSKITINIESLKSGVYIIKIASEGRMFNRKLLIK